MPQINWDDVEESDFSIGEPGEYLMEVETSEERNGQNGPYFSVLLRAVEERKVSCFDIMSFSSKALPITKRKLLALGADLKSGNVDATDLIGLRAWVSLKAEQYKNNAGELRDKLSVNINARGFDAGYKAEEQLEKVAPKKPAAKGKIEDMDSDIPF